MAKTYTDAEMNKIMSELFPDKGDPNATIVYWDPNKKEYTTKKPEGVMYEQDFLNQVVNFDNYSDDFYNQYYKDYYKGYQGYTPVKTDISALLKAFEDQANTARSSAKNTYDTTLANLESSYNTAKSDYESSYNTKRQDLLTSALCPKTFCNIANCCKPLPPKPLAAIEFLTLLLACSRALSKAA